MLKVKLEIILNEDWDNYADPHIIDDNTLLQDVIDTLTDQRAYQEEVVSMTIKSKQCI